MKKLFFMFAILLSFVATANSARSAPTKNEVADQAAKLLNQDALVSIDSISIVKFSALKLEVENFSLKDLQADASNTNLFKAKNFKNEGLFMLSKWPNSSKEENDTEDFFV